MKGKHALLLFVGFILLAVSPIIVSMALWLFTDLATSSQIILLIAISVPLQTAGFFILKFLKKLRERGKFRNKFLIFDEAGVWVDPRKYGKPQKETEK